jgi:hypothetical protein
MLFMARGVERTTCRRAAGRRQRGGPTSLETYQYQPAPEPIANAAKAPITAATRTTVEFQRNT